MINDSEAGYEIVTTALKNGKDVVSASKKMLAEHLPELIQLQETTGKSLLYEASACASIPVIRNLEEYYDNDLLHAIKAIVNGSTNFILTKMFEEKLNFKEALLLAQQLGFAESDPTLDIEGFDAANKWVLLLAHSYGINITIDQLLFNGITQIDEMANQAIGRLTELLGSTAVQLVKWQGSRDLQDNHQLVSASHFQPRQNELNASDIKPQWRGALPTPSPSVVYFEPQLVKVVDTPGQGNLIFPGRRACQRGKWRSS